MDEHAVHLRRDVDVEHPVELLESPDLGPVVWSKVLTETRFDDPAHYFINTVLQSSATRKLIMFLKIVLKRLPVKLSESAGKRRGLDRSEGDVEMTAAVHGELPALCLQLGGAL